jgi:hypothetical protein
MNNPAIDAFRNLLAASPEDWHVRTHLATMLEQSGDRRGAAQTIMEAPYMPTDHEHLTAAVRILTPINPASARPFLEALGHGGHPQAAGGPSVAPLTPAATPTPTVKPLSARPAASVSPQTSPLQVHPTATKAPPTPVTPVTLAPKGAAPTQALKPPQSVAPAHPVTPATALPDNLQVTPSPSAKKHWSADPNAAANAGEIKLTKSRRGSFGLSRFMIVTAIHAAALAAATAVVVAVQEEKPKDDLKFDATPPRLSANKGTSNQAKMAKKKSSTAPASAKRVLVNASAGRVTLPAVQTSSPISDSTNFSAGGTSMSSGFSLGGISGASIGSGPSSIGGGGAFMAALSMESRCAKGDRDKRIAESGGSPQTEVALKKTLDYLKNSQNKDGSWGKSNQPAMTGLAVLAFLGHCETPESKEYGENVLKAIVYLVDYQMKKGYLSSSDKGSQNAPYQHGIAAYALGEAYSMTRYGSVRIPNLREALIAAVDVIVKGQGTDGGWSYGYKDWKKIDPPTKGSDMSVSGWQIQALNAARHTGVKFPGADDCFAKAIKYVEASQVKSGDTAGAFGYRGNGSESYSMTGVAGLCLIIGGKTNGKELRDGTEFIKRTWDKLKHEFKYTSSELPENKWTYNSSLYASYYVNQVAFMRGGSLWTKWNKSLQADLLPAQNANGSFRDEGKGEHSTHGAGADADHYRACLCALMLEVYYRYLPATENKRAGQ